MTTKEIDIHVRELFKMVDDNSTKLDRALTLCYFAAEMLQELRESYDDIGNRYNFELRQHIQETIYQEAITAE